MSLQPLAVWASPTDIRDVADALTLLVLMAMVSSPVGLLAALAVRGRLKASARCVPHEMAVRYHHQGQPIR